LLAIMAAAKPQIAIKPAPAESHIEYRE